MLRRKFPHYMQAESKDCGPTCLKIICRYYNKIVEIEKIRRLCETTRLGSTLLGLVNAAESLGFKTLPVKISFGTFQKEAPFPCIVHWDRTHYVVVYKIKKKVYISDPGYGLISYDFDEFIKRWIGLNAKEDTVEGIVLFLEPTPNFQKDEESIVNNTNDYSYLFKYLFKYKKLLVQLVLGLVGGSLLTLIFPFLTQSIVDIGIRTDNINFIYLVLIAHIMLFVGKVSINVIRDWILLHLSTRINISLVSDFFIKLMKLPINYFDTRMTGDIMQRINDHQRIEHLLTNTSLNSLFSLINLILYSCILAFYNYQLFLFFFLGSGIYLAWILLFQKMRRDIDSKRFIYSSIEQSKVIELINGMQEIKLYNAEKQKRWSWEFIQIKLFKISLRSLTLEQKQEVGSNFINEIKNIIITFVSATLVINGNLTLGMMLSVQYIIGQLNAPLLQLIKAIHQMQDAKISLERLEEIHSKKDEENSLENKITEIKEGDIQIDNVQFRYTGQLNNVIDSISFIIPANKITAIVGASGSGKTTLMKLILGFYDPSQGEIKLDNINFKNISKKSWRDSFGVVMQEGYIFNDTIANNIALGDEIIDKMKLKKAVEIANVKDFIESLPLSYNTKIGNEGIGISGGQKQRILIARAAYKNPKFIFFDEATSSLDANNERIIMENLNSFFRGKTSVIIAHRLSTVKNADQIIVLDKGKIIELGHHSHLIEKRGTYFKLVQNQLELEKIKV